MKSTKFLNKRSVSPLIPKVLEISERKKKLTSNNQPNPYRKSIKDFQTYAKGEKKKQNNYLQELLKNPGSANKYRIVTEPVQQRILSMASVYGKMSKSKGKRDLMSEVANHQTNIKSRNCSNEKPKVFNDTVCANCQKYAEQIQQFKSELKELSKLKFLWKNGQMSLQKFKSQCAFDVFNSRSQKKENIMKQFMLDIKRQICDLMGEIQNLSEIDYPKMLSLNIFKYQPRYNNIDNQGESELKDLLGKLREQAQGKITNWDIDQQTEDSDHIKAIMRNIKNRLSHYMRQNLELKIRCNLLNKNTIAQQSYDFLKELIEEVLKGYSPKKE